MFFIVLNLFLFVFRKSLLLISSNENIVFNNPFTALINFSFYSLLLGLSDIHTAEADGDTIDTEINTDTIAIIAKRLDLIGIANSASQGVAPAERIVNVPILRPGEILEQVPGLIVTQHSGSGKANQFFLRGFNLDHGTDFSISLEGTPVNMPSHGHGQGYADANFLIPELIENVDFRKGPYFADLGDFSAAGATRINYYQTLPQNIASATLGEYGYQRLFLAGSTQMGAGNLLAGLEVLHDDGPFKNAENFKKINGVLRW